MLMNEKESVVNIKKTTCTGTLYTTETSCNFLLFV